MHRTKKNRESSAPRGSQYIDGQLIHMATNQKMFHRTHMCTVFRETLKPGEHFLKTNAERVMDKNLKKRQAHGTINILEDRFTLEKNKSSGKEPFRSWLGFHEIDDIQRCRTKPEYFVLSVNSERSAQKYYEVYKCKNKDEAYKVDSYIRQAMEDPEGKLRDGPVLDVVQVRDDPNERRSLLHVDFQTSSQFLDEDSTRHSTMYQATSPTPPRGYSISASPEPYSPIQSPHVQRQEIVRSEPSQVVRTEVLPIVRTEVPQIVRSEAPRFVQRTPTPPIRYRTPSPPVIRRSPTATRYRSTSSLNGLDDVTYIDFDPRSGRPHVSEEGPVYMYFARKKNQYANYSPNVGGTYSPVNNNNSTAYNGRFNGTIDSDRYGY